MSGQKKKYITQKIVVTLKVLCICVIYLFPQMGWSHALAPSLLQLTEQDNGVALLWKTSKKFRSAPLSPKLPLKCRMQGEPVYTKGAQSITVKGMLNCGKSQSLVGEQLGVVNLEKAVTTVVLRYQRLDGSVVTKLLSQKEPAFLVPEQMDQWQVMKQYFVMGVEHLIFGYDHVLFVLALLLLIRRLTSLLWAITFFTVGHSFTLILSSLRVIAFPVAVVEVAIAVSIVYMALEIYNRTDALSSLERRAWLVPMLFGLLHGLGFASALAETGLPDNEIPAALLSFNVGLEAGQLLIVTAFVLLKLAAQQIAGNRQLAWSKALQLPTAYAIGCISAFWVIERGYGLFFSV